MNKYIVKIIILSMFLFAGFEVYAQNLTEEQPKNGEKEFVVRDFILEHVGDAYIWHITRVGERDVYMPLPVIVMSKQSGWHVFSSSKLSDGHHYAGFYISETGNYKGKIVEENQKGAEVRPIDISITKNVFTLILSSVILVGLILFVAGYYKKNGFWVKNKLVCFMEMFIMMINDDVIKPCVGKGYKKFAPYLLTLFFFLFINNLMGLIPIFPFGANLTGNIAVTFTLAIVTFIIVNIVGTKEYWKEIFWPDVPILLKFPVPFFPLLEIISVFTKPFALMIRLLANMIAGHSIILGLLSIIFITVSFGKATNVSLTAVSLFLSIFISFVELLVAFIQAYIFTLLSAVYIGLAQVESHKK
jgi:F-type H+-transporting ATPase subunit a